MIIVSISGPCGGGKSTSLDLLGTKFPVIKTVYRNTSGSLMDSGLYVSKIDYTEKWFTEIGAFKMAGVKIAISDRSPIDCLAYLREYRTIYSNELKRKFDNLKYSGVVFKNILLTAKKDVLEERITQRKIDKFTNGIIERELQELSKSMKFFQSNKELFDLIIDNSNNSPNETINKIEDALFKWISDH